MQFNFKSIVSDNRVQANIDNLVTQLNKSITNGVIVHATILTTDTKILHTLGRPIKGWYIVDKNAPADIWQPSTNEIPNLQVIFRASVLVQVKIYFF